MKMSKFSPCPKCGKKGYYTVRGYDPSPEKGILQMCKYCQYAVRITTIASVDYVLDDLVNEHALDDNDVVLKTIYKDPLWDKMVDAKMEKQND
jgi:hypothetical protein